MCEAVIAAGRAVLLWAAGKGCFGFRACACPNKAGYCPVTQLLKLLNRVSEKLRIHIRAQAALAYPEGPITSTSLYP